MREKHLSTYVTMWKQNRAISGNTGTPYSYNEYYKFLKDCFEIADLTTPLKQEARHVFHLNIGTSDDDDDSTAGYDTDVSQACDLSEGDLYSAFVADQI